MATVASISWVDSTGAASLTNSKPFPGDRFATWEPSDDSIGPKSTGLGTGIRYAFEFRSDSTVSFSLDHIPEDDLAKCLRLQLHLRRGGGVIVVTGTGRPTLATQYYTIAPEQDVTLGFMTSEVLEYRMNFVLLNISEALFDSIITPISDPTEPFSPINIPDLWIWHDALDMIDVYSQADAVDPFFDRSGNAIHAYADVGNPLNPNYPQFAAGILPAVLFNQAQAYGTPIPAALGRTIVVVGRRVGALSASKNLIGFENLGSTFGAHNVDGISWMYYTIEGGTYLDLGGDTEDVTMLSISADADNATIYRNAVAVGSPVNPGNSIVAGGTFILGGYNTAGGNNMSCYIHEALLYQRKLTADELDDLHDYLTEKWVV